MFAAVYFWFPAMTGRTADNAVSKLAFWLNLVGTQLTFWPLFIIGVDGMPRRYWDYSAEAVGAARSDELGHSITISRPTAPSSPALGIFLMIAGWVYSALLGREGRQESMGLEVA